MDRSTVGQTPLGFVPHSTSNGNCDGYASSAVIIRRMMNAKNRTGGTRAEPLLAAAPRTVVVYDVEGDSADDVARAIGLAERTGLPLVNLPLLGNITTEEAPNAARQADPSDLRFEQADFALRYVRRRRKVEESAVLSLFPLRAAPRERTRPKSRLKRPQQNRDGTEERRTSTVPTASAAAPTMERNVQMHRFVGGGFSKKDPALAVDLQAVRDTRGGGTELLIKACGKPSSRRPGEQLAGGRESSTEDVVWDLTAGIGRDSTILARDGRFDRIVMFERSPVVAALLEDGLLRLAREDSDSPARATRSTGGAVVGQVARSGGVVEAGGSNSVEEKGECAIGDTVMELVVGDALELLVELGNEEEEEEEDGERVTGCDSGAGKASSEGIELPERLLLERRRPSVVYLDPMFPPRSKKALVKQDMQVLHALLLPKCTPSADCRGSSANGEKSDNEEASNNKKRTGGGVENGCACLEKENGEKKKEEAETEEANEEHRLLACARAWATRRVVVKRPRKAPPLGGLRPSTSIEGTTSRFDIYLKN